MNFKELLIKNGVERAIEEMRDGYTKYEDLEDIDMLHDILMNIRINGERIECNDDLYERMVALLEEVQPAILKEVDSEMDYYYGIQAGYDAYYSDRI